MYTSYIVCGSPGSGKSTYARQLAAVEHATLLDIDTVTERLVRIALVQSGHSKDDRDSECFKRNFREPIYETLFDIAIKGIAAQTLQQSWWQDQCTAFTQNLYPSQVGVS